LLSILLKGKVDTKNNQLQLLAQKLKADDVQSSRVVNIWNGLNWYFSIFNINRMDMFSTKQVSFGKTKTYFDLFCTILQEKLKYAAGERDIVIMHHVVGIENRQGKQERLSSTMISYGDPSGYSAMAKTVGLPTAIAAEMILKGKLSHSQPLGQIKETGVIAPMSKEIYDPMLKKLESEGIKFIEKYEKLL
jgi:alpha-aminoadipic semialdehyde synthase